MCVFNYEGGWQPQVLALSLSMLADGVLGSDLAHPSDSNQAVGGEDDAALRV